MKKKLLLLCLLIGCISSCKKSNDDVNVNSTELEKKVLLDFAQVVVFPIYQDMEQKAGLLVSAITALNASPTDSNLVLARNAWRNLRKPWEQSEAFLFGPVEDNLYDPEIDTWPVNHVDIESVLSSSITLDLATVLTFQSSLKGFHPLEYILFGNGGNKTAAELTIREREFMVALAQHLQLVSNQIRISWDPAQAGNFMDELLSAGAGSTRFPKRQDAWISIVSAMAGICDEVAGGKMQDPLIAQDSTLEESQYSKNSLADFRNNLVGVSNVYFGRYSTDGTGMNEWLATGNISLENRIGQKIQQAIGALDNITLPYGQAIYSQQFQIQLAQSAILDLKTTLEDEFIPYIFATIKN